MRQFPAYATSVSALAFSPDGQSLAIAVSYCFEEGEREYVCRRVHARVQAAWLTGRGRSVTVCTVPAHSHPNDSIVIKPVSEADFKTRSK